MIVWIIQKQAAKLKGFLEIIAYKYPLFRAYLGGYPMVGYAAPTAEMRFNATQAEEPRQKKAPFLNPVGRTVPIMDPWELVYLPTNLPWKSTKCR